ncbi:MAG TPA: hypothetical protein VEW74_10460 [Candidatus Nitrosotalea sp.]|nr:hypothetical protein [Candidatus Nitrosotalea sp.]
MAARIGLTFIAALGLWIGVAYSAAQRACAHDPRFVCSPRTAAQPVRIPDASKSWAYYGGLAANQSDEFTFTLTRSAAVPWTLLLDTRDVKNPARPAAALFDSQGRVIAGLDFAGGWSRFYEPFSRESYLQSGIDQLNLSPGTYRIVVTMSGTARQRYVMAIGEAERFSPLEIPYVAGAVARIRAQRY